MAAALPGPAPAAQDAFPGADGYGRAARGGRGGAIIAVTTLADAGPGSLRACIDARGPRVCVFRVAGVIRFTTTRPVIRNPYLTIAGQTAPGGGIVLTHAGGANAYTPLVIKNTHDVIIRHIRVRPDRHADDRGANSAVLVENSRAVIIDHVSGSWAVDQNMSFYGDNDRVTVSWSIWAEGVQPHDKCALLASDPKGPQHVSFIGNLCAHNGDRNPDANFPPGSCVDVINNVFYNAASQFAEIWETYGGTPVNIIGNVFRAGPNTSGNSFAIDRPLIGSTGVARIFLADNLLDGERLRMLAPVVGRALVGQPVCNRGRSPISARQAYARVLDTAGALPRDGVDTRVLQEVRDRSGRIPKLPGLLATIAPGRPYLDDDRDGMDDLWERRSGMDPRVNDAWGDVDRDGWSNLDEFLDARHRALVEAAGLPTWQA